MLRTPPEAVIGQHDIFIHGTTALRTEIWDQLLKELEAKYVPGRIPFGHLVYFLPDVRGRVSALICTHIEREKAVQVLKKYSIEVRE